MILCTNGVTIVLTVTTVILYTTKSTITVIIIQTSEQLKELRTETSKRLGNVEDSELTVATLAEQIKKKDIVSDCEYWRLFESPCTHDIHNKTMMMTIQELDKLMTEIFELRKKLANSDEDSVDSSADADTTVNRDNWWV